MLLGYRPPPCATARQPTSAFVLVARVVQTTSAKVAVFNAQSISNKFVAFYDRITAKKPSLSIIVETWHDSADCPSVIACTPMTTIVLIGLARVQQSKSTTCLPTKEASVCYTRAGMAPEPCRCQPTRRSRYSRFIYTALASICWSALSIA